MKVFPEKLAKKLPDGFAENISSMSEEEIRKKIVEFEGNVYNVQNELEGNEEIARMKAELKEATAPFRERKKEEAAKITYALFVLDERGVEIGQPG